eukprot:403372863
MVASIATTHQHNMAASDDFVQPMLQQQSPDYKKFATPYNYEELVKGYFWEEDPKNKGHMHLKQHVVSTLNRYSSDLNMKFTGLTWYANERSTQNQDVYDFNTDISTSGQSGECWKRFIGMKGHQIRSDVDQLNDPFNNEALVYQGITKLFFKPKNHNLFYKFVEKIDAQNPPKKYKEFYYSQGDQGMLRFEAWYQDGKLYEVYDHGTDMVETKFTQDHFSVYCLFTHDSTKYQKQNLEATQKFLN